jgi:Putative Ig domain
LVQTSGRRTILYFGMKARLICACCLGFLLLAIAAGGQSIPSSGALSIPPEALPKAALWEFYYFRLPAAGGTGLYHWRVLDGSLPAGLKLADDGELSGVPQESGQFNFVLELSDSDNPPDRVQKKFTLLLKPPLTVEWSRAAKVNGQRIEGSVKVSNHTGRDFDLTFIVLAVNEIGRATAIGYQHFPLKKKTNNLEIPFGNTLSLGNYQVNVDVVGEEPVGNHIYRARLVTAKESVTQGP